MTFKDFLDRQIHRKDPIGDLARDAKRDPKSNVTENTFEAWDLHLQLCNACDEARYTLKEAWGKYLLWVNPKTKG